MAASKDLFKVIFMDEDNKPLTIHAGEISPSSLLGFIEAAELAFPEPSDIIIAPSDDRARSIFKDVKRVYIPVNRVIRVDELQTDRKAPVISLVSQEKQDI